MHEYAGRPLGFLLHQRQVLGIAAGQQRQGVEGPRDRILTIGRICDTRGQDFAALLEDAIGLRAVIRGRRAVRAEHGQLHDDGVGLAFPPPDQRQLPAAGLGFGRRQRLAELRPRVVRERLAADPEDHVTDREDLVRGRTLVHLRDVDLPRVGGRHLVGVDPSAKPRGAKVPIVIRPIGDHIALGEIGQCHLLLILSPDDLAGCGQEYRERKDGDSGEPVDAGFHASSFSS